MFRDKHFWIGACFVVALAVTMALLVGCSGMSDDEVRAAKVACRAKGGSPVVMQHLYGDIAEVNIASEMSMMYSLLRRVEVRGELTKCFAPKWGGDFELKRNT